jgi:hypothetical protein
MTPSSRAGDDAHPEMPRGGSGALELSTDIRRCRAGRRRRYAAEWERALWLERMRSVQPKTAFSRFPRVHRADFEVHKGSVRPVRHSRQSRNCAFRPFPRGRPCGPPRYFGGGRSLSVGKTNGMTILGSPTGFVSGSAGAQSYLRCRAWVSARPLREHRLRRGRVLSPTH